MEAKATTKFVRTTPRKMRRVVDMIRGQHVVEARRILRFSPLGASKDVEKLLNSAVANAEQAARAAGESVDVDNLYVKHAVVNEGTKLKRFTPAAMGRATPVQKRTSHVHIIVAERES